MKNFALALSLLPLSVHAADSHWRIQAAGLASEDPTLEQKARRELAETPELASELRRSLKSPDDPYLALTVIRSLGLKELVPELLRPEIYAKDPPTVLATVDSLVSDENRSAVLKFNRALVSTTQPAGITTLALATLGRAAEALSPGELKPLLASPSYEVRIATVRYLSLFLSTGSHPEYLGLVWPTVEQRPYQLRLEALAALSSLPPALKKQSLGAAGKCLQDVNPEVRRACAAFQEASAKL